MTPTLDGLVQNLKDLRAAGPNLGFAITTHWMEESGISLKQFVDAVSSSADFDAFMVTVDGMTANILVEYPAAG